MLSAGNNIKPVSSYPSSTRGQSFFEEQKRAELKAQTGFEETPIERLFADIFSFKSAKTGIASGSFGWLGCGASPGAQPGQNSYGPEDGAVPPDRSVKDAQAGLTNRPPILEPVENKTIDEGEALELHLVGSDPDNNRFTYSAALASGGPLLDGMSFNSVTGTLNWTPTCLQSGVYRMAFTVTDDGEPNLSASREMNLSVTDRCVVEEWTYRHSGDRSGDGYGIAVDGENNVYAVGAEYMAGSESNLWIQKLNSAGSPIWTERYNNRGTGSGHGIGLDSETNVYVTGSIGGETDAVDIWVSKFTSGGVLLWNQTYNGSANLWDYPWELTVDPSANVYVVGHETTRDNGEDILVAKYNSEGSRQWIHTHNSGSNQNDDGYSVAVASDGSVYVGGTRGWLRKLDEAGSEVWTQTYEDSRGIYAIAISDDGAILTKEDNGGGIQNLRVRKLDSDGSTLWTQNYEARTTEYGGPGLTIDRSGNFYICGSLFVSGEGDNVWLGKFDPEGEELWTETHNGTANQTDFCRGISLDANNNVYAIGSEDEDFVTDRGNIWVSKYRNAP